MARLYSNENFPLPAVEGLRRLGQHVLTIQEAGKAHQSTPDEQVLKFAIEQNRALLTLNRKHFVRLHRENPTHSGLVVCTFDPDFLALAQRVHEAIEETLEVRGSLDNQLIRISRPPS
jgi:sugar phosphate isomerase/epimerase